MDKIGALERAEHVLKVVSPEYVGKVGRETIEMLTEELSKDEMALRAENDRLKRLCRYQYMTLGYYSTPYNYDTKNIAYHPETGQAASGIMCDGGHDARQASAVSRALGFDGDEICSWAGPGVKVLYGEELEAEYKQWLDKRLGKT